VPAIACSTLDSCFQGFNLFPTLTPEENVELMLDLKGISAAAAKKQAHELLEQVGWARNMELFPPT